jgi:hypothetical protein
LNRARLHGHVPKRQEDRRLDLGEPLVKVFRIILLEPMVITTVQDYIAAGQFRSGEQLVEPSIALRRSYDQPMPALSLFALLLALSATAAGAHGLSDVVDPSSLWSVDPWLLVPLYTVGVGFFVGTLRPRSPCLYSKAPACGAWGAHTCMVVRCAGQYVRPHLFWSRISKRSPTAELELLYDVVLTLRKRDRVVEA